MEKKRQEPERMETIQGGAEGHTGEHDHKRVRSLSVEVPGLEPMLSDPGEPHKCIPEPSSRPEQKASGRRQMPGEAQRGSLENPLLGKQDKSQKKPLLGQEDESQKHPLLGEQTQSMENDRQERARREMEKAERERSASKKPAA